MINKDFLREVLADQKKLMKMSDVRPIHMPKYDELSVKNLFPRMAQSPDFMLYFPDKLPKDRLPDR
jgi:hypothetical protein